MRSIPKAKRPDWPGITWTSSRSAGHCPSPRVLGLNPWIDDFAAFNLWSRPAGLLACLDAFRLTGASIALLDCLDPSWDGTIWPKSKIYGQGHYPKHSFIKPPVLNAVPRKFSRYGLPLDLVEQALQQLTPPPDLILVTTAMTYWYTGAAQIMTLARRLWPNTPIALGGTYATLCPEHAHNLNLADAVIQGPMERPDNWQYLWKLLGESAPPLPEGAGLSLALDLYPVPRYSVLLGSRGCPFSCAYCGSRLLHPGWRTQNADTLFRTLSKEWVRGVTDFAFLDDALLVKPDRWLHPFLDKILASSMTPRLHTPNAVHVRYLTPEIYRKLKAAGLTTVRLGLETADFGNRHDSKLTEAEWEQGAANLLAAGFQTKDIGAYILFGLPDQDEQEVVNAIRLVRRHGFLPKLAHYTPIPGTPMFDDACRVSQYPLIEEPLCHNNSIWPCVPGGFSWEKQAWWTKTLTEV